MPLAVPEMGASWGLSVVLIGRLVSVEPRQLAGEKPKASSQRPVHRHVRGHAEMRMALEPDQASAHFLTAVDLIRQYQGKGTDRE